MRLSLQSDNPVSHAKALELVAHQHGCRDWNTLVAAASVSPAGQPVVFSVGEAVTGAYLGNPFSGRLAAVQVMGERYLRITVRFDAPVEISRFDSFSFRRRRVTKTIDKATGTTVEKTSDGVPQLTIHGCG